METERQTTPRRPGDPRAIAAASIILFGSGALAGVGLSNLAEGNLAGGALFALLGAAMVWASLVRRPAPPEA